MNREEQFQHLFRDISDGDPNDSQTLNTQVFQPFREQTKVTSSILISLISPLPIEELKENFNGSDKKDIICKRLKDSSLGECICFLEEDQIPCNNFMVINLVLK